MRLILINVTVVLPRRTTSQLRMSLWNKIRF